VTRAWLLRRLVGDGRRHGVAWLALAAAFAAVAFSAVGARLLWPAPPPAAPAARVIAYLDDVAGAPGAAELERVLAAMPGVESVRAVSARDDLALLRRELGPRASVLEGVGAEMLSPSLEIAARPAAAEALAVRLRRLRGISDVDLVAAPAARPEATRMPARLGMAAAGALGLLALVGALALLRARLRVELGLWLALGLTRAASARPALWLATAASAAGGALGGLGASWAARAWLGLPAVPARELALGAAGLFVLALAASRVALRVPEAAGAG
jgi:hypothetical protein